MKKTFLAGLATGIFMLGTVGMANANIITGQGHIYDSPNGGIIDNWYFSVDTAGLVNINVFDIPNYTGDTEINLFFNDILKRD